MDCQDDKELLVTQDLMAYLVLLVTKVTEVKTVASVHQDCPEEKVISESLEDEDMLVFKETEGYLEREATKE
jgi:hypothetical protein